MQKRIMRLIAGAMIGWMLMASGELSGAAAMPESAKWANVETVQENQPATIDDAIDLESAAAAITDASGAIRRLIAASTRVCVRLASMSFA